MVCFKEGGDLLLRQIGMPAFDPIPWYPLHGHKAAQVVRQHLSQGFFEKALRFHIQTA
jgi:hypothetical protein